MQFYDNKLRKIIQESQKQKKIFPYKLVFVGIDNYSSKYKVPTKKELNLLIKLLERRFSLSKFIAPLTKPILTTIPSFGRTFPPLPTTSPTTGIKPTTLYPCFFICKLCCIINV